MKSVFKVMEKEIKILDKIFIVVAVFAIVLIPLTACGGTPEPQETRGTEGTPEPQETPIPGEWTSSTEFGELEFTVNPNSTGIAEVSFNFVNFECDGSQASGGVSVENPSLWSINDGQFTIEVSIMVGDVVIDGEFDETGNHASGTWEIRGCSGTWEASPGF